MTSNFYECFRHETCGSKDCSRIAKFLGKVTSHGYHLGDVDDVQRRFRFAKKGVTDDDSWVWVYGYDIEFKAQSSQWKGILLRLRRQKKNQNRSCW